jgi:hypothetical protein
VGIHTYTPCPRLRDLRSRPSPAHSPPLLPENTAASLAPVYYPALRVPSPQPHPRPLRAAALPSLPRLSSKHLLSPPATQISLASLHLILRVMLARPHPLLHTPGRSDLDPNPKAPLARRRRRLLPLS